MGDVKKQKIKGKSHQNQIPRGRRIRKARQSKGMVNKDKGGMLTKAGVRKYSQEGGLMQYELWKDKK